jgi:cation transport regulator ChaC
MDSHHDQVMQKRESAQDGPPRLYFAYSTILDRQAFEEWKAQHGYDFFQLPQGRRAQALDAALVYDFPSRWWGGRVAGLEDRAGSTVHGLLFEISPKDWAIIQHKEGAVTGMCVEREVRVRVDGEEVAATAFVTNPARRTQEGPISQRFLEALERGARSAGLPEDYVRQLRSPPT